MDSPTKIFYANPLLSFENLEETAVIFRKGGVIAIPTETVYGLAADLFNESALSEIFRTKGRPSDNPLIAHIGSMKQLNDLVEEPSDLFFRLAERFWPGALTLIAPRSFRVPNVAAAGLSTVAIRMPSHPCTLQILQRFGPLAAPSANLSGCPSPTSAADVLEDFKDRIPLLIDGGTSSFGIESTVVDVTRETPILLRPGAISRRELEEFLGMKLGDPKLGGEISSPGMKYRHYAPKAKIYLVESREALQKLQEEGAYTPPLLTAQNLYAELRRADRLEKSAMAIYLDTRIRADEALMNRLEKASAL